MFNSIITSCTHLKTGGTDVLVRNSQPLTLFQWWNGPAAPRPQLSGLGLGTHSSVKPPPSPEDKVALGLISV